MRLRLALVTLALLLAGCAERDAAEPPADPPTTPTTPTTPTSPTPPTTFLEQPTAPPLVLTVAGFDEGSLLVTLQNDGDAPVRVEPASFTLDDAGGGRWTGNASDATDALAPADVPPGGNATGRVHFGFATLAPPARLTFLDGARAAAWVLHVNAYEVRIDAQDDTSFGQPIELPANGTIAYRATGISGDVALCIIEDAQHETWLARGAPSGYGCRSGATAADASVLLPPGTYNVGMACRSDAPCAFTLTVIASW